MAAASADGVVFSRASVDINWYIGCLENHPCLRQKMSEPPLLRKKGSLFETHNMWKVYSRPRRQPDEPVAKASINVRGEISMNFEAWQRLREPYIVTLWYDLEDRMIAIRSLDAEQREGDASSSAPGARAAAASCRAQRLFTRCRIKITERLIFTNPEINYGRMKLSLKYAEFADKTERRKGATMEDGYFW